MCMAYLCFKIYLFVENSSLQLIWFSTFKDNFPYIQDEAFISRNTLLIKILKSSVELAFRKEVEHESSSETNDFLRQS